MAKYTCPVCGKEWETTSELAECVRKDALKEENDEREARAAERKAKKEAYLKEKNDKIASYNEKNIPLEKNIENKYKELKSLIEEYNTNSDKILSLGGESKSYKISVETTTNKNNTKTFLVNRFYDDPWDLFFRW